MEENMKIFNLVKRVPKEAKKTITGGRLKGMTDIKPMWRIEKLTEMFGPCGIGWKTKILNKEIIDVSNGEKIVTIDIHLFIKQNGEWSEPIEGIGGNKLIAKENNGLYNSDEAFKMAYTDALSVACKSLGMGAEVYWGDSKYTTEQTKSPAPQIDLKEKIEGFKKWLETNNVSQDLIQITLEKYNVNNIDEMTLEQLTNVTKEIKEVCKI
nr:MAG TPA: DNA REPAIR PROTEIN RAD52 HOMOLOG-BINDING PROTEIN, DNA REPAIR, DNA.7A [Caudoviricetes sp.]